MKNSVLIKLKVMNRIKSLYRRYMWSCERYARYIGVKIGKDCSIATRYFGSEPYLIEIGDNVQITNNVKFFCHGAAWVFRKKYPQFDFFGKIKIGNNVYIGNNALVMAGVTIGDNVIIAAGSVITKSIEDNSIVGGNPAKTLGSVDDLGIRMAKYNLNTKGLNYEDKKKFLLNLDNDKFIIK